MSQMTKTGKTTNIQSLKVVFSDGKSEHHLKQLKWNAIKTHSLLQDWKIQIFVQYIGKGLAAPSTSPCIVSSCLAHVGFFEFLLNHYY